MKDLLDDLAAAQREVARRTMAAGEGWSVRLRRTYPAPIEDVWDALTNPQRLHRWFLPVSGDLRAGGSYQLEGNAGGEIVRCEPPQLLKVTWVVAEDPKPEDIGEVRVTLTSAGEGTVLDLEHAAVVDPKWWDEFGPGSVGVGWDLTLLGLGMFLRGESIDDPQERAALGTAPEGRTFIAASSEAWGNAYVAAGAPPEKAATAVAGTTAFYAPPPIPLDGGAPDLDG